MPGVYRAMVFNSQIQAAIAGKAAAIMTWEVLPMLIDTTQDYDFTWSSDGGQVIQALTNYATCLVQIRSTLHLLHAITQWCTAYQKLASDKQ